MSKPCEPECPQECPPCSPGGLSSGVKRPPMRGLLAKRIVVNISTALFLSGFGAFCMYLYGQMRRKIYADVPKNWDWVAIEDDMAKKGLFQAVPLPPPDPKKK